MIHKQVSLPDQSSQTLKFRLPLLTWNKKKIQHVSSAFISMISSLLSLFCMFLLYLKAVSLPISAFLIFLHKLLKDDRQNTIGK